MKLSDYVPISGIYKITNKKNGKSYIGQSKEITTRWSSHVKDLIKGKHSCKEFLSDFQLYGLDCFDVEILEECDGKELLDKEGQWAINIYRSGSLLYNLSNDKRMINLISTISGSSIP